MGVVFGVVEGDPGEEIGTEKWGVDVDVGWKRYQRSVQGDRNSKTSLPCVAWRCILGPYLPHTVR